MVFLEECTTLRLAGIVGYLRVLALGYLQAGKLIEIEPIHLFLIASRRIGQRKGLFSILAS